MNYIKLGNKIKAERQKKRLTQSAFAEAADISDSYLGYIERGERSPALDTITRIAETLDVSISYLIDEYDYSDCESDYFEKMKHLLRGKKEIEMKMAVDLLETLFSYTDKL